jgi:hypothetical protein
VASIWVRALLLTDFLALSREVVTRKLSPDARWSLRLFSSACFTAWERASRFLARSTAASGAWIEMKWKCPAVQGQWEGNIACFGSARLRVIGPLSSAATLGLDSAIAQGGWPIFDIGAVMV